MTPVAVSVQALGVTCGRRLAFDQLSFTLGAGQCLGVMGQNGAGKTTLLRTIAGCIVPAHGEIRINGLSPRDALTRVGIAYFAGEATLPSFVQASAWGKLGTGEPVTLDRRPLRALSRGGRQLLGLRTVLGRHPLGLILLDEPWEGLDPDGARWLSATLESKRDRGAAVILSSHRLDDLAGLCDAYLFLVPHRSELLKAHEISHVGPVTPALLQDVFEKIREGSAADTTQAIMTAGLLRR